jgi:hypothetical protein
MMIFLVFAWRFRVVALHLRAFFHRQLRQMPNEEYQFPVVLRSMRGAQAGMLVKRIPFSMIQNSSPSESFCVSVKRKSGGFGYKPLPYRLSPLPSFS